MYTNHLETTDHGRLALAVMALTLVAALVFSAAGGGQCPSDATTGDAKYVSSSGDDAANDGSRDSPYATLLKAFQEVADNGTIYLLSDIEQTSQMILSVNKTVTITSADNTEGADGSKKSYAINANWTPESARNPLIVVKGANVTFTDIVIDGTYQIGYPDAVGVETQILRV